MGSVQDAIAVPATVDQHPHVQRHAKQRAELETKLKAGQAKLTALHAERDQLQREHHQAEVAFLLGDGPSKPAIADRLAAIEAEISASEAYIAAARDAQQVQAQIAAGVRQQVQQDIDQEVAAAAHDVCRRMAPLVRQVLALNTELTMLLVRSPSPVGVLPVPHAPLLDVWLAQLAHLEG